MTIADRLKKVSARIQQSQLNFGKLAGSNKNQLKSNLSNDFNGLNSLNHSVKLLAVSKTHPISAIQEGFEAGITEFAESYLQEAEIKIQQASHLDIIWHFIGPIQSNKTRLITNLFDWVQSIDRTKVLQRINDQRPIKLSPINVCIQVNYFKEENKKGANLQEVPELLELASKLPNIKLRGLMFIPPKQVSHNAQLGQLTEIKAYFDKTRTQYPQLDTLSMGMSNDFEAAIEAGSSMVRIGTELFGKRRQ
ncbi:MAG: YggS family pyridoxal phosphate-dependent enzyme [Kangiella sp.]|nr:MAG: YggS family pyridoxal phosphate-dependent enzyme [Kangiella sp.]